MRRREAARRPSPLSLQDLSHVHVKEGKNLSCSRQGRDVTSGEARLNEVFDELVSATRLVEPLHQTGRGGKGGWSQLMIHPFLLPLPPPTSPYHLPPILPSPSTMTASTNSCYVTPPFFASHQNKTLARPYTLPPPSFASVVRPRDGWSAPSSGLVLLWHRYCLDPPGTGGRQALSLS